MTPSAFAIVTLVLLILAVGLLVALLRRQTGVDVSPLLARFDGLERGHERTERMLREERATAREEGAVGHKHLREEIAGRIGQGGEATVRQLAEMARVQNEQLSTFALQISGLTEANERRLGEVRDVVNSRLEMLQTDNAQRLEQIRVTVDEKLQGTLERRLGESFKLVSDRLEQVHKGLGEMQALAIGVGDLRKVLTNVKTRGTWGEIQLGALLEQVLTVEQYATNVCTKEGGSERVEYAVRLPGQGVDENADLWLPIDSKFPIEAYLRLVDAQEAADPEAAAAAGKELERSACANAKCIHDKYLSPPRTTDFGIMFLPTEGLFAEIVRRPELCEKLRREFKVVVVGPTTLFVTLNSLRMGFRTLALQKGASEVAKVLGAVKQEFDKFGGVLDKVQKKLTEASNVVGEASKRSRAIERQLKNVETLPLPGEMSALPAADIDVVADVFEPELEAGVTT